MDSGVAKYIVLGLSQRPAEMLRHVGVSLVARVDVHMQLVVQKKFKNWDNYSVKAENALILLRKSL
jgi:hypothetical protein